ncbi:uncharacterized protein [Amphiura filiformis]|uniref:uncharacterized protein n=1 Tax=Amphiura filiformis TaxID=82378 RepID=UPI003B20FF5C
MSHAKNRPPTPNKTCKVIVHQARNLIQKGKDNSWNNAFVIIALGKDKFITSVAEKSQGPRWNEECELPVTKDDTTLELNVLHRGMVLDDFLGQLTIPMGELGAGKVIKRWYKLCNKANKGKKEPKERGELELTIQLKEEFPAAFNTLDRSGQRSKAKRSSSLQEKPPATGIRSKLKLPRLRSSSVVDKNEEHWLEQGSLGREKSDSNDSGKASDSLVSADSPTGSYSRLPAPFGSSSHDASETSSTVANGSPANKSSPSIKKVSSFKKKIKSVVSLKKGKAHDKSTSSISTISGLPHSPSEPTLKTTDHDMTLNEIEFLERLRDQECPATNIARKNCYRGYIASAVDLHDDQKGTQNGSASPMRAISEEYIPMEMKKTRMLVGRDVVCDKNNDNDSQASGTGSQEGSPAGSQNGSCFSRDSRLRHSFRSGLPSLKNSTVSVTFDPSTEKGYGTNPCSPKSTCGNNNLDDLPVQYLSLSKQELVRRVVRLEALLTERKLYIKELENYIDNLLLKVMLSSPLLLDQDYHFP